MLTFPEKSLKKNVEGAISHLGEVHSRCGHGAATRVGFYDVQSTNLDYWLYVALGSQCILSSSLCRGREPTSRNEFLVYTGARSCSCYTKTCVLYLSRVHGTDLNGMGVFSIRNIEANDLRARKWNNFHVFAVGDKLLVYLEGGLSKWT